MSQYLPTVAWSTIASNVRLGLTSYRYLVDVNYLDPNEPGATTMTMVVGDWFIDFAGYPFIVEDIDGSTITVYDILERGDGVTSAYGPYANKLGYVYRPLNGAIILTQAQLRKLDQSAPDIINPIEKGIIWAHDFWEKDVDENIYQLNTGDVIVNRAIKFPNNVANPPYQEGLEFYDFGKHAMSYYNDEPNITVTKGQEVLIPVYNNTASTIANGKVVYLTGSILPAGETEYRHTIALADARYKAKCRTVAVATHDIEANSSGYVTRIGSVGGLNTVGLSGQVYLSTDGTGNFTNTIPDDGAYIVEIGAVKNVHATEGSITVDPKSTELTVEVTDTNGFPAIQRTNTILSFNDSNRTFTISASSYPFHYYDGGIKYEKLAQESIIIDDIEGLHVFYYEDNTLSTLANPNDGQIDTLIRTTCLIAYIYWDATNNVHSYFGDERHGISMSPDTHAYLHFTRGAQYLYGLGLGNILTDENGSLASHAQFSIEGGMIADEDITTTLSAIGSTVGLPIYYLSGANGDMRRTTQSGFSVKTTGTGRLAWNQWTGAVWQLTEVTDGKYVLCHVLSVNGLAGTDQQIAIIGQAEYSTSADARAAASTEIASVVTRFPFQETIAVATVIFQTKDSYTNSINARIISTADGDDYINWLITGSTPTSHSNLTNLNIDDHLQYALLAGRTGDVLKMDNINEVTLNNGVSIDGVNIKDGEINFTYLDKYTNTTPMPVTVGGAEAGTTFNEQRIDQMLTAILYPYQYPAFTAFGISGQTTPIEVGNSIAANRTFTWTATNPTNVATNSLVIRDVTGSTNIKTGVANDGMEATVHAAITKTTATTNVFSITGTNTRAGTFTRNYTVTWQWKVYYGESTTTPLVETNIEALRIGVLMAGFAGTYTFNALSGGYKYLCYPSVLGTATSFKDTSTQLPVPMETVYTVSVTNLYGVTTNYNVHRSTNILNDAINIIVA